MPYLVVILISGIINFSAAWYIQHLRFSKDIADIVLEHGKQIEDIKDLASSQLIEMTRNHAKALQNATSRNVKLSRDVVATRDALVRLSNASKEAVSASRGSLAACHAAVDTFRVVFDDCGKRYEQMGRDAQGYVIDKQTLIESRSSKGN